MDLVKEVVIFNDVTIDEIASKANLAASSAQSTFLAEHGEQALWFCLGRRKC